jgi:hypothetical protein
MDHFVVLLRNMGATCTKYGVSVIFYHKLLILGKIVGQHLVILSKNLKFYKTWKNSNTVSLCSTDLEYGGSRPKNTKFWSVFAQTCDF